MAKLRIALAQINPRVGDLEGNLRLIGRWLGRAREAGADLVTFPELAVTGYPPEDLLLKPRFLADSRDALERLAPESKGITAVVGYAEPDDGGVYNSAALLHDGRLVDSYRKLVLPNYGVFDESRYFTVGRGAVALEMNGLRLMLTICEDIWVAGAAPEAHARALGAQLALNISGSPYFAGKLSIRRQIAAGFAGRSGAMVAYNNLVGGQDELIFDGGSLVVDAAGGLLARARRFEEDLLVCELELAPAARPPAVAAPHRLHRLEAVGGGGGAPALRVEPELDLVEEVHQALILGIRDYLGKTGFSGAVLGLSGGVDSSLVAALAVEALGAEHVVGVTMPSRYTSQGTRSDAERLAQNLGIRLVTLPIGAALDAYLGELAPVLGGGELGVTSENLQARIRGNLLMALSNHEGWLVLTTGNKSELAVGYCTLYGDMAGGFAVIKDLPKTLVYELSRHLNQKAGRELIPESVLTRPPSAELRPDQTDQDSLPPYEVLDPILKAYVEEDKVLDEIVEMGFDPAVVKEVVRLVDLNEYKRRQAPPGVKITPKAFGRDRRLPICNFYRPGWS
jgi:NAD+ synthase (glutamine-hydrolysing)